MEKIITTHVYPPIPIRHFDWSAYEDGYEPDCGDPVGWGATEESAILDLAKQATEDFCLTDSEMKSQAERCGCHGSDDLCVCQNNADAQTMMMRASKWLEERA